MKFIKQKYINKISEYDRNTWRIQDLLLHLEFCELRKMLFFVKSARQQGQYIARVEN